MTNTFSTYESRLILSLRMLDVPGDKIGQIVAEVQAHVAETGEDPEAAFGAPDEYAKQFDGGAKARGAFHKASFIGIPLIAGGAFVFVQSVFAFAKPDDVPGYPSVLGMLLIAIVLVAAGFYFQVGTLDPRQADPVLDPATVKKWSYYLGEPSC